MEAVSRGVKATIYSLSTRLQQTRELVLSRAIRERVLQNTAFIQTEKQSVVYSGRTMKFRPESEAQSRENT